MQIKKTTVFTAELSLTEIELITDGLGEIKSRYTDTNDAGISHAIDNLIEDFKLIRTNGIQEVRHNA